MTRRPTFIASLCLAAAFGSVACASMSQGTVEGWAQGRLLVRSDELEPGEKVIVKHYIQCRTIVPCRWYETHGIVQAKMPGVPSLVTVAVPIVVNAPTSAYLEVGDEVRRTKE